jgi:putative membrane protein
MNRNRQSFLTRWIISGLALLVAIWLLPQQIHFDGSTGQFILLALIFGLVNAFLRPILRLLSCPLILLTLGLFIFVVNAVLLAITAALAQSIGIAFTVEGFGGALLGAIVISIVSILASLFIHE